MNHENSNIIQNRRKITQKIKETSGDRTANFRKPFDQDD